MGISACNTALLTTVLLLAGYARTGGFLLGLLPSIHAAMALVLWPWGLLFLLAHKLRRAVIPLMFGVTACALLAALIWVHAPSSRGDPPYDLQLDGAAVFQTFTTYTDVHRQLPPLVSLAYVVNTLAFLILGSLFLWLPSKPCREVSSPSVRAVGAWLLLLGAMSWTIVYASWIAHRSLGTLPTWVYIFMPYRFSNVCSVLLLPLSVALLARLDGRLCIAGRRVLTALTMALIILAGLQTLMTENWSSAMQPRDHLLVVLWGFVLGGCLGEPRSVPGRWLSAVRLAIAGATMILALAIYAVLGWRSTIEFGAATTLACTALAISRRVAGGWQTEDPRGWQYFLDGAFALVCVAVGLATLHNRYPDRAVGNRWNDSFGIRP